MRVSESAAVSWPAAAVLTSSATGLAPHIVLTGLLANYQHSNPTLSLVLLLLTEASFYSDTAARYSQVTSASILLLTLCVSYHKIVTTVVKTLLVLLSTRNNWVWFLIYCCFQLPAISGVEKSVGHRGDLFMISKQSWQWSWQQSYEEIVGKVCLYMRTL